MMDTTTMIPLESVDGTVEYVQADDHPSERERVLFCDLVPAAALPSHLQFQAPCRHGSRIARIVCPPLWSASAAVLIRYEVGERECAWVPAGAIYPSFPSSPSGLTRGSTQPGAFRDWLRRTTA